MNILIIGGTRNLGYFLSKVLLEKGHTVTILNRGQTLDTLPKRIERLRADRSDPKQLKSQLERRYFDAVVDTTLYNGNDTKVIIDILKDNTGHYVFLSSGQVYLVRTGLDRPFIENDYFGSTINKPVTNNFDYENLLYGINKRQAEDVLFNSWAKYKFPFTTLRLPMVNSERDHFNRIYGYLLRLFDGGPILVPAGKHLLLRHVYGMDVVNTIIKLIENKIGLGLAYNISQDETITIEKFISLLAGLSGKNAKIIYIERNILESLDMIPDCSPFSDPWMSELDNQLSKTALNIKYTPLQIYLEKLIKYYEQNNLPVPIEYNKRSQEIEIGLKSKYDH